MSRYIMRLDDASPKRNIENWNRMELLLDKYDIKPMIGVIPHNEDPSFAAFNVDNTFWHRVHQWENKGWTIAMHGYNHVYMTSNGGINPVNACSEFAGLQLDEQKRKIASGVKIMKGHGINPEVFFAPSHTFDKNTLVALKEESNIKIISDTIAYDVYFEDDFFFVPQQSGRVRKLPFKTVTFCYHPDELRDLGFEILEKFLTSNKSKFIDFNEVKLSTRKRNYFDLLLKKIYFIVR